MPRALLTIAHGTVDDLDDLPAFLKAIRRGHTPPDDLVAEVRRRYHAIGGQSPLNAICAEVTRKLGERLGMPARMAMRMWAPQPERVLEDLAREGIDALLVIPLAQHSAPLYVETVRKVARERATAGLASFDVKGPPNWGREPKLTEAFAAAVRAALRDVEGEAARVVFTAHSLPLAVIRGGDPYEAEVRASAAAVAAAVGPSMPPHELIFQSQGMSGGEWLGPDVKTTVDRLAELGDKRLVFAPIGFLADHVEILYDLDIEARAWTEQRGMSYSRTASLNASDALLDALEAVARGVTP
jgi:protoporphyrin/coproporphyrin ferrochelatase